MKELYTVIYADGTCYSIESDAPLMLEDLQALVGGPIELVPLKIGSVLYDAVVNEEGRLMKLSPNKQFPHLLGTIVIGRVD